MNTRSTNSQREYHRLVAALPVSIVIPAHNEARVIERCLHGLTEGAAANELELIVVCNGCTDDTAERARVAAPEATVLELDVASKSAALNAGDRVATRFPRFYVDADIELAIDAVRATAAILDRGDVPCAAPAPNFDTTGRPWYVRSFFRVFCDMPFMSGPGVVGTGVYALSRQGRERFTDFPAITADDQFVMERFATQERWALRSVSFTVHPPRDLPSLLNTRQRTYRGNAELRRHTPPVDDVAPGNRRALMHLLLDRHTASAVPVYLAINAIAKMRAMRAKPGTWERDESTR